MSLIGTIIYQGHHWMNTRDEVLSGLTCTFDRYRLGGRDARALWPSDLSAWIALSFV
jgi:hypothetical protein